MSFTEEIKLLIKDRILSKYSTATADEFYRFVHMNQHGTKLHTTYRTMRLPDTPPDLWEKYLTLLQSLGYFELVWEHIAPEAQTAWGSKQSFVDCMRAQPRVWTEVVYIENLYMIPFWLNSVSGKTYQHVAMMLVRYCVVYKGSHYYFRRYVHLVPSTRSWQTLIYPTPYASNVLVTVSSSQKELNVVNL